MGARRSLTVVGCHAGGKVGNVVVGGVLPPPGETVYERMQALRADDSLRRLLLREPRGSVAVHANLIVPSNRDDSAAGFIHHGADRVPADVRLDTVPTGIHRRRHVARRRAPDLGVEDLRRRACRSAHERPPPEIRGRDHRDEIAVGRTCTRFPPIPDMKKLRSPARDFSHQRYP